MQLNILSALIYNALGIFKDFELDILQTHEDDIVSFLEQAADKVQAAIIDADDRLDVNFLEDLWEK